MFSLNLGITVILNNVESHLCHFVHHASVLQKFVSILLV